MVWNLWLLVYLVIGMCAPSIAINSENQTRSELVLKVPSLLIYELLDFSRVSSSSDRRGDSPPVRLPRAKTSKNEQKRASTVPKNSKNGKPSRL